MPKTVGMSIEAALRAAAPAEKICPIGPNNFIRETDWRNAAKWDYFFSHDPYYVQSALPGPLFIFTFLRDPVDRAISAYNHILRDPLHRLHDIVVGDKVRLWEAFDHPELWIDFSNIYTRSLGNELDLGGAAHDAHAMYVAHWFAWKTRPDRFTIARAHHRVQELGFIGFIDRIEQDLPRLFGRLELPSGQVPHINGAPGYVETPLPLARRDRRVEDAIAHFCEHDVALYAHARAVADARLQQYTSAA